MMINGVILNFINLFVSVFNILILIRVLMSWVAPNPQGGLGGFVIDVTEPILGPLRKILPQSQIIDLSPIVAFLLMQVIQIAAVRLLAS